LLLQIDGLSSKRLKQALARGDMPHLRRWLESGGARLRTVTAATPPSTPVFQAGLLYGEHAEVPGFGWYDRGLGRAVRMDLAEDVTDVEATIHRRTPNRPLLEHGVSYGTIWPAGAANAFFNVVLFVHGQTASGRIVRNLYDQALSILTGGAMLGRLVSRFFLEMGVAGWDFVRWCRRIRSTRFEWRFLYMRLFVSVVMRDVSTQGAVIDVLRGVPVIYIDYLGYDEYAHRRGPDSEMALYNLRGIDGAIARIRRAAEAVPEYGYDVYVFSDHGQSATTPFERVVGCDLHQFVLEHASAGCVGGPVESSAIRELVALRETAFWVRTLWRPIRPPMQLYVGWLERRLSKRLRRRELRPLYGIQVVTGGSIAHLYFGDGQQAHSLDQIARRWPRLFRALAASPAIGLLVGRGSHGPIVIYRGRRYDLADRAALEPLEPFRMLGYDLLCEHLAGAACGARSGDLVLYGAFAEAGEISFDFEFGSHGGIAAEELDQFVLHPAHVDFPLAGAVRAEDFYRFFHAAYGGGGPGDDDRAKKHAA
jgi:hypothetical protein